PVSAYVVFTLLVSPMIRAMQGRERLLPDVSYGKLDSATTFNETREEFIRVRASHADDGSTSLSPYAQQGSGVISSLPWATGVARIPANTLVGNGDTVAYYDFAHWQV
ncbi:MAG TPA: molybdopterin molybdenumtransferase MoeA, partial [Eoetvoesiella sp.]|nr:molybdopterin molybdenumtransferase MoeA [Eoetvoesiella sp.]